MIDVARHIAFKQEVRLTVTEFFYRVPEFIGRVESPDACGRSLKAWLQEPGRRDALHVVAQSCVVENVYKIRDEDAALAGAQTHRQFVAEVACACLAHARNSQVFAQGRRSFKIEIVERNDAVNRLCACQEADASDNVVALPFLVDVRNQKNLVNAFTRPVGVSDAFGSEQQHATILTPALAHKLRALFITCQAENS